MGSREVERASREQANNRCRISRMSRSVTASAFNMLSLPPSDRLVLEIENCTLDMMKGVARYMSFNMRQWAGVVAATLGSWNEREHVRYNSAQRVRKDGSISESL